MEDQDKFIDYYKVLESDRTASSEELKKNYQRLALMSHPDKNDVCEEQFLLIQKAWTVLRDPQSRKHYNAILTCHEHSECLLFDTISLSDMIKIESDGGYAYSCRCGGTYILEATDPLPSNIIIGCNECSFSIQVIL